MPPGSGGYVALRRNATELDLGDVTVWVAGIEDLIAMKRASGRLRDLAHLEVLAALQKAAGASGRFELSGATLRAVPAGSCSSCSLVIQQQGTVSDGVRIVFEDGKPVPLVPVADVARALGGKLSAIGGVYAVTAGGCGACVLGARP